ncbi:MAG TPA: SpaH/EbpB family LPXTG-anchored major pilin [Marmoricola sp.]|jgi:fimbrial isopeptide formation D2 family protein/LPXTG-motif cell wall-anchored protein|nr:SpaH/EbpB family LPXTG-anchored major pilin [Marmoricola sp.]
MSHPSTGRLKTLLLAIAAIAVALVGLGAAASAASPSLPDPTQTGSILIHKFKTPDTPTGLPANGTVQSTTGLTPVDGVTFSIQQVNGINLTTNQGWLNANALSLVFNPSNAAASITGAAGSYTLGTATSQTTAGGGNASFLGLPLGLYLVSETAWPAGTTPSAPFLVSVPLTDPTTKSGWLYNVNVYPKNSVDTVSKTVDDASAVKLGDPVVWTIKGDIPNVSTLDGYKITDQLAPQLTYVGTTVSLSDNSATLTAGTDYNLTTAGNLVSIVFTGPGLIKLAAHNTAQVVVSLNTTVNAVGEISNTAQLYPNANSITTGTPTTSPPVVTKWGSITFQKTDPGTKALTGAVFSVYPTLADAKAGTNAIALGTPAQTTFPVDSSGLVTISGLRYSDWDNGAALTPLRDYYLGEVTAPTGYELLAEPIKFDITQATSAAGVDLTIKDVPSNGGFQLPFTGGHGLRNYYIAGAVLIGLALVLSVRRRQGS